MVSQTMLDNRESGKISGSNGEESITPETEALFNTPFHLEQEEAITLSKNYVLHMDTTKHGSERVLALGLSSYEACVYSMDTSLRCTATLPSETTPLVDLRFASYNPSLLYTGCSQGIIKLWDLRTTTKAVQEFRDTSDPKSNGLHDREFCSFDVNISGGFVCAGTAVTDGDAYLMFWDTRKASLLGGYWECHMDDITQVKFHPSEPDKLVTGSTDGLINMYDISQSDEDEALLQSFNTESSVEKVKWHEGSEMSISCVTHTADVQLWHLEDGAPYNSFTREDMESVVQMNNKNLAESLYVADVHSTSQPDQFMVLTGSNKSVSRLRSAVTKEGKLSPYSSFHGNKQIVRCSWFDPQGGLLVTAGEGGIVSLWKAGATENVTSPTQLKVTSKLKEKSHKTKSKPY
ncbi:WD repeat-containing protein 89 [Macrosteles quadrilineatus]|uniref:WD repeat-containing protein 89 n=1 Tax=Macrosteles quadrilineatus TaxID=74068 RepID=UPI0023E2D611|nr:WD repeat-containing protein 89 [Macrosteles quadrilineatus]